jgi:hypothetical protein
MANERVDSHYDTTTCSKEHADIPTPRLKKLHTRQAGPLRHRCAACAYEMGVRDGIRQAMEQIEHQRRTRAAQKAKKTRAANAANAEVSATH